MASQPTSVPDGSNNDNNGPDGPSAADIIAYIGIPLAVLGVVPIFYTFLSTIVTLFKLRRSLRENTRYYALNPEPKPLSRRSTTGLLSPLGRRSTIDLEMSTYTSSTQQSATTKYQAPQTRTSVLSGIIELDLPRYQLHPLHRDIDPLYWSLNPHPSHLKGGSWTLFNWNAMPMGKKTYRLQFAADLQEPQAEIEFEALITFLLDWGCVPDAKGISLIKTAGMWTPSGTALMRASGSHGRPVLRVAFPDDSEGLLSLTLTWEPGWEKRNNELLPPHWIRIRDHPPLGKRYDPDAGTRTPIAFVPGEMGPADMAHGAKPADVEPPAYTRNIMDEWDKAGSTGEVRFYLTSVSGKPAISLVGPGGPQGASPGRSAVEGLNSHDRSFDHLLSPPVTTWYPTLALALANALGTAIWTAHIPDNLLRLAAKDSLPCGVLVEIGLMSADDAPKWATEYDPHEDSRRFHEQFMRTNDAERAESRLGMDERTAAKRLREASEQRERLNWMMEKGRRDAGRLDLRRREAVDSVRLDTITVAERDILPRLRGEKRKGAAGKGAREIRKVFEIKAGKTEEERLKEREKSGAVANGSAATGVTSDGSTATGESSAQPNADHANGETEDEAESVSEENVTEPEGDWSTFNRCTTLEEAAEKILFLMAYDLPPPLITPASTNLSSAPSSPAIGSSAASISAALNRQQQKKKTGEMCLAVKVCTLLERWQAWTDRGGMTMEDLDVVSKEGGLVLAYGIVLMAVLRRRATAREGSLALDLMEVMGTWKRVRLG